ncbi:MAG: helix-turn-helix domain-containing protein [Clostridia bacterium]|nr:helix-turn-helix domain-containing protein [Clostridia bacterium]
MENWSLQMALHDNSQNCEFLVVNHDRSGRSQLHSHQFVEIEYVLRGSLIQIINGVEYHVQRGDIIYLNVGDCHEFKKASPDSDVDVVNIMFMTNQFFKGVDAFETAPAPGNIIRPQNADRIEIENLIMMIDQEYNTCDRFTELILKNLVMSLVCILIRHSIGGHERKYSKEFERIINFVDNDFSSACLEKTAAKFGYNSSYFSRFFEKNMGINFSSYVAEKKINLSKDLLVNTKDPIDVISYKCGFNSQSAFYRMFQKRTGMTPKKYRQLNKIQ